MNEPSPQPPAPRPSDDIEAMLLQVTSGRDALAAGQRIGPYVVEQTLGRTDIAVRYRARGADDGQPVDIEEYLPDAIARRDDDGTVRPRADELAATFEAGRRAFVDEARCLMQPLHPALLQVKDVWDAHGTAYRALPPLRDPTLDKLREGMSAAPGEPWLLALLQPLAGALAALHAQSMVHGNVRPGSVVVRADGEPLLLGFDAARWALGDVAVHPEPAFLAIEQTERQTTLATGAWTDLYALGALALYCLDGRAPTPAAERVATSATPVGDAAARNAGLDGIPALSAELSSALDRALAVLPTQRLGRIDDLRAALGDPVPAAMLLGAAPPPQPRRTERPIRFKDVPPVPMAPDARAPGPSTASHIRIDLRVEPDEAAAAADDDAWRAMRPGELSPTRRLPPPRASRGWWLAAAVPIVGIALLAWHWDRLRETEQMVAAFGSSLLAQWSPEAAHGDRPAPAPAAPPRMREPTAEATTMPPTPVARNVPSARAAAEALLDGAPPASVTPAASAAELLGPGPGQLPPTAAGVPQQPPPQPQVPPPPSPRAESEVRTVAAGSAPAPRAAQAASPAPQAAPAPPTPVPAAQPPRPQDDTRVADTRRRAPLPEPEADNPREACSPRTNFALYRCMQTQCERDRFYAHAQCVRLRLRDEVPAGE